MNVAILLFLFTSIDLLTAQPSKLVDLHFFKQESCSIELGDDDSWYDPQTHILFSNNTISDVQDCNLSVRQKASFRYMVTLPDYQTTLLCVDGVLHSINILNNTKTSHNYRANSFCDVRHFSYSTFLDPDIYLTSNTTLYKLNLRSEFQLTTYETSVSFSTVHLMFRHGNFVYIVYTNTDGEGSIGRFCGNDDGTHRTFQTFRQGGLSCSTENTEHRVVLSALHNTEPNNLILLMTRPPAALSGRVLCSISLQDIDNKLNTGDFLDYDEQGNEILTQGSEQKCRGEMSYLSEIKDVIRGSQTILKSLNSYLTFTHYKNTWYLAADGVLDLREDAPLLSRSSEANNFLFQSIRTDIKHPIRLDVKEDEVTVVGSDAVTFLPLYICSHLQEPAKCYSVIGCSWSVRSWKCVISEKRLSFSEEHPSGITQVNQMGCTIETTTYNEYNTTLSNEEVKCEVPALHRNVEVVFVNRTCMGALQLACKKGTYLLSGHLDRYCLPMGEWSGIEPVCQDQQCDELEPGAINSLSSDARRAGSLVSVLCKDSCETPINPSPLLCTDSGRWNSSISGCKRRQCAPLDISRTTELVYSDVSCGSVHVLKCAAGTDLVRGDLLRTCQPDGSWSGSVPHCQVTSCGTLPSPQNGELTSLSQRVDDVVTSRVGDVVTSRVGDVVTSRVGDVVTITCDMCFTVSNTPSPTVSTTTECLPSGDWSTQPQCLIVTCPVLQPSQGTAMKKMNNTCRGLAEFECAIGHTLASGDLVRHCQNDGTWSGEQPTCEVVRCPPLEVDASLIFVVEQGTMFGERAVLECAEGTEYSSGTLELHCHGDGTWRGGSLPVCTRIEIEWITAVPLPVTSNDAKDRGLVALAVVGWLLFISSLVFILMVALLAKRGLLSTRPTIPSFQKAGELGKYSPRYERQVTQSTTTSLQRSRHGTATLPAPEKYVY